MKSYSLRKHQLEFIRFFKNSKTLGVLAWHDMGLGKTLASLHIGIHYCRILRERGIPDAKLAILCPKSIVPVWKEHINDFFSDVDDLIDIIPYSQLKKYGGKGMNYPYKFLILDEIHYLRNIDTQRFGFFLGFLGRLGSFDLGRIIGLSGTPMINSGADLYVPYTLCKFSDFYECLTYLHQKKNWFRWRSNFTVRNQTFFGVKYEGIRNSKTLYKWLAKVAHRRKLDDCVDMPDKTTIPIDLKIKDDALLRGVDINNPDAYMSVLEALSRAKTPKLVQFIKDEFVESGKQCIVFSSHKVALKTLSDSIKGKVGLITGEQTPKERERILKAFKEGSVQILGITYACGAEGLNLQHCNYAVYHSYPWTSALFEQAQARIHRPGQKNKTIHYVLTSGECDRGIFYTVMKKKRAINTIERYTGDNVQ